ncbi:MAG: hypothetical protein LBV15_02625, partial [Planctomycetota bacterium]|nr:hypothetical protein [Planctomycetota bacterium]
TATYDSILAPLDRMLRRLRNLAEGDERDPLGDYDRTRAYAEPIMEIAQAAYEQSQREREGLRKNYRFLEQKGEACQRLAAALWNRLEALYRSRAAPDSDGFVPAPADSERLEAVIGDGLDAAPANRELWRLHARLAKANGIFGRAESDLRKALGLDSQYGEAWNDLGLVLIHLRRFDEAGEAFVKAKELAAGAAKLAGRPPGADYAAALLNLADLHVNLAEHYRYEAGASPGDRDIQDQLRTHMAGAAEAVRELLDKLPPDSPEAREGQKMLSRITY